MSNWEIALIASLIIGGPCYVLGRRSYHALKQRLSNR